jgi:hypothetical protein
VFQEGQSLPKHCADTGRISLYEGYLDAGAFTRGAPWYIGNRKIHEDLGVPFFADHIIALTESFDSKLADVGKPLVQKFDRFLR